MVLTLLIATAAVLLAVLLLLGGYGRRSENWGATAEEAAAEMTGDDWLEGGTGVRLRMTRAVRVEAPAETVWPWIAQLGRGAGWYSYDRLDNGGRPSATHLVGWIPAPRVGDATAIGYLRHLEPRRELVWWLAGVRFLGARFRGAMLYRVSGEADRCRLVMRVQAAATGAVARPACWLLRVIDGFMARRQLVGIRRRAELFGERKLDPEHPETGARDQYQLYHALYALGEEAGVRGKESARRWRRAAIDDGVLDPAASEAD